MSIPYIYLKEKTLFKIKTKPVDYIFEKKRD